MNIAFSAVLLKICRVGCFKFYALVFFIYYTTVD